MSDEFYNWGDWEEEKTNSSGSSGSSLLWDDSTSTRNERLQEESDADTQMRRQLDYARQLSNIQGGVRASSNTANTAKYTASQIGTLPTLTYGTFEAPERDEEKISSYRTRAASPGLRELRRSVQSAIQGASGLDPSMRRLTLKDALQGYGSSISRIMNQADQAARRQYEDEYKNEYNQAQMNYTAGINKSNAEYQAALARIMYNAQIPKASSNAITIQGGTA